MKRSVFLVALLAASMGALAPIEPAGACSVYCPEGELTLELAEVRLISSTLTQTGAVEAPEWSSEAELLQYGQLRFSDDDTLFVAIDGGVL